MTTLSMGILRRFAEVLRRACSKIPGLYTLLDMQAKNVHGKSFAELFLTRPSIAYTMLVGLAASREGADMVVRMILRKIVGPDNVDDLVEMLHKGYDDEFVRILLNHLSKSVKEGEDRG